MRVLVTMLLTLTGHCSISCAESPSSEASGLLNGWVSNIHAIENLSARLVFNESSYDPSGNLRDRKDEYVIHADFVEQKFITLRTGSKSVSNPDEGSDSSWHCISSSLLENGVLHRLRCDGAVEQIKGTSTTLLNHSGFQDIRYVAFSELGRALASHDGDWSKQAERLFSEGRDFQLSRIGTNTVVVSHVIKTGQFEYIDKWTIDETRFVPIRYSKVSIATVTKQSNVLWDEKIQWKEFKDSGIYVPVHIFGEAIKIHKEEGEDDKLFLSHYDATFFWHTINVETAPLSDFSQYNDASKVLNSITAMVDQAELAVSVE